MENFLALNSFTLCPCLDLSLKDVSESRGSPHSTPRVPRLIPHHHYPATVHSVPSPLPSSRLAIPLSVWPEVTLVSPPRPVFIFITSQLRGARDQAALCTIKSDVLHWAEPTMWNKPALPIPSCVISDRSVDLLSLTSLIY